MKLNTSFQMKSVASILGARGLNAGGLCQQRFTSEVARQCDPYIPYLNGPLKNQRRINVDSIVYTQPYAKANYYGNKGMGNQGIAKGGKRGKQWAKRMWADKGRQIVAEIAKMAGGKPK